MKNNTFAQNPIKSWVQFREVAASLDCRYLDTLDSFPNSVLVAGCQRSGTTILANVISESEGMVKYYKGEDSELECALILSGLVQHVSTGRYCFQTTYLDDKYHEYFNHPGVYKLIWLLRNPYSTIYSLLYNWPNYALYRAFNTSVLPSLRPLKRLFHSFFKKRTRYRIKLACLMYNWKIQQIPLIRHRLKKSEFAVLDYDDLVNHKEIILPMLYSFIQIPYKSTYADKIHSSSIGKKDKLSKREVRTIRSMCETKYINMLDYVSIASGR